MKQIPVILFVLLSTIALAQKRTVDITTSYGKIEIVLYDKTPKHRDNMIKLVKKKYYDSILFHRVIPGFVIQGGDPTSKTAQVGLSLGDGDDLKYTIPAEINNEYFHQRAAVGMAREENPDKASSPSQFYIVVGKIHTEEQLSKGEQRNGKQMPKNQRDVYKTIGGTPSLDGRYTVFGIVTKGMDIVNKIANEPRNAADRPNNDVRMIKARMKKRFLFF